MSGRGSQSGGRSSEVERIIAAAEVDTTFAGKKARYRGRRSVRNFLLFVCFCFFLFLRRVLSWNL